MKNPCRTCEIFAAGNGYDNDHCLECGKRTAYVASMGPMVASMPDEYMDITRRPDPRGCEADRDRIAAPAGKHRSFIDTDEINSEETEVLEMETKTADPTRVCPRKGCKAEGHPQPVGEFGKNKTAPDGLQVWCKQCTRDYAKDRYKNKTAEKKKTRAAAPPVTQPESAAKTKICTIKECKHEGRPQPIENFGTNRAQKDGLQTCCKDCKRRYDRNAARAKSKARKRSRIKKTDWMAALFEGQPELREKLDHLAADQMRTPRRQLLYMVKTAG